jgi:hypothetical protein
MGIFAQSLNLLCCARRAGASFERTATIGRQSMLVDRATLRRTLRKHSLPSSDDVLDRCLPSADCFAEPLFALLGATHVESIDISDYEGASIVHDMNLPIPAELKGKYTVAFDGGSLEHVFNFPVAIANCIEMLAVGGHFVGCSPCNNQMGHGFYQFSPELYFRVFSKANGFVLQRVAVCEESWMKRWYNVTDPDELGERVHLLNCSPTHLLIQAQKIAEVPFNPQSVQQSDYAAIWQAHEQAKQAGTAQRLVHTVRGRGLVTRVCELIPKSARPLVFALPTIIHRSIRAAQGMLRPFPPPFYTPDRDS